MNFLKRALCAIGYYKRNTFLLFLIFTILFTLILSGLCVRDASVDTARRMGMEVGGALLVESKVDENGEARSLSLEAAKEIAAHPAVKRSLFTSSVKAKARGGFKPVKDRFAQEEADETALDITLLGCDGVHPILRDDSRLVDGRRPREGDKDYAVLHRSVATGGFVQVAVGDTITVAASAQGEETELTVIGIYHSEVNRQSDDPAGYADNCIFVSLDTVEAIAGSNDLQGGEFVLHDPAEIPRLQADIEAMGLPQREKLGMIALDGEYQKIAISMDNIVAMTGMIFWAAIVLGAILLTSLVMIFLSSREFEIGVLLSMGEGRGKVILQLAIETLVPVLLGVTAGALLSTRTAALAAQMLGASARGVEVGIEGRAVGLVYLCGAGLALLASCVTAYKILCFKPKKLMMALE